MRGSDQPLRPGSCGVESTTGQVFVYLHRRWLRAERGWGSGQLRPTKHHPGTTGKDLCPSCLAWDEAAVGRRRKSKIRARRAAEGARP